MNDSGSILRIGNNIAKIKIWMQKHPELRKAHHFSYDHRLQFGSARVDYVVMGINPGETQEDCLRHKAPPPGEETSEFDFHLPYPTPAKIRWQKNAEFYCGNRTSLLQIVSFGVLPKHSNCTTGMVLL